MGEPARNIEHAADTDIPVSRAFVEWARERAAATGRPVEEWLDDPSLRSFAALVDGATPEGVTREREMLRIRRDLYGGDIMAECRALRDGSHPLATVRTKA